MIGKVIKILLDNDTTLNSLVPIASRYPYVLNEDTQLPAIIYTVDSLLPVYDKQGWVGDECIFSIVSFSDDYSSLQTMSAQIRTALELKEGTNASIKIQRILLTGQLEGYNITENVFMNKLTFSTVILAYA